MREGLRGSRNCSRNGAWFSGTDKAGHGPDCSGGKSRLRKVAAFFATCCDPHHGQPRIPGSYSTYSNARYMHHAYTPESSGWTTLQIA